MVTESAVPRKKRKAGNGVILSKTDKVGQAICIGILALFCVICIFPFLNVLFKSFSGEAAVLAGEVKYWPKDVQFGAYKYVMNQRAYYLSLKNTTIVVVIGTALALLTNGMTAYAIGKKRFRERGFLIGMYIFTMVFSGGLIPGYLLVRSLGLYDSLWALILPAIISPYYLLILKSFMAGIPNSIEESATIDGAGHFTIFFRIVLPIAKPAMASMCLFFAVDLWNDFFRPLIFLTTAEKYTLQLYLRNLLISSADMMGQNYIDPVIYGNLAPQSIQNATIIVSIIPILLLYPFLQKYFVTGITLGSVKG